MLSLTTTGTPCKRHRAAPARAHRRPRLRDERVIILMQDECSTRRGQRRLRLLDRTTRVDGVRRGHVAARDRLAQLGGRKRVGRRHDADSASSCVESRGTRKNPSRIAARTPRAARSSGIGGPTSARSGSYRSTPIAAASTPRRIDLRQHVHVLEDRVQLRDERLRALVVESEPRERRDVANVVERDRH